MENNTFKLIGIDPGNNLGVSIYTIDGQDFSIKDIEVHTFILENFTSYITTDKVISKLEYIRHLITGICKEHTPLVVALESAFMNSRFPKAVINLSQYVGTLELTIKQANSFTKVFKYPPKYIKSTICKGDADKNAMLKGVSKIQEITTHIDPAIHTEHVIDATAIGYVALKEIREMPFLLMWIM